MNKPRPSAYPGGSCWFPQGSHASQDSGQARPWSGAESLHPQEKAMGPGQEWVAEGTGAGGVLILTPRGPPPPPPRDPQNVRNLGGRKLETAGAAWV